MTILDIAKIVGITLFSYWIVGCVIFFASDENETFAAVWTMGLVYCILWLFFAPYRIIRRSTKKW